MKSKKKFVQPKINVKIKYDISHGASCMHYMKHCLTHPNSN